MKKFTASLTIIFLLQFIGLQNCWAEIRTYVIDKIENIDSSGHSKEEPILVMGTQKPITLKLVIAGLGTQRVTAQMPNYNLSVESQIFPLDQSNGTGEDGSDWYYTRGNIGVTVIEIHNDIVKVYGLGNVTYVYVGKLSR